MLVNVGTKLLWFYFNNFDIFQLFELYNYTKIKPQKFGTNIN